MLVGLGAAPAFISIIKVVVTYFPEEKRPIFLSYSQSLGCLGPVIFGPLLATIVKNVEWRSVMFVFSLLGLALAFFIWKTIGSSSQGAKTAQEDQETSVSLVKSLKAAFKSPQIWVLALFSMMQYVPLCALADLWGTSFIKKLYSADTAVCSLANNMIYVGLVCGNPFFAYLAVAMNSYKKPMCIAIFSCFVIFGAIMFIPNIPLGIMFALFFLMGFTCGAMLAFPLATALFDKTMAATISGFINMVCMLSGVISMPLIGYLIDLSWDGVVQNGMRIYRIEDFRFGFMSVLTALFLGFLLSLIIKDKAPAAAEPAKKQ
jgi:MFS family permease